jgi:hypothetical protein
VTVSDEKLETRLKYVEGKLEEAMMAIELFK